MSFQDQKLKKPRIAQPCARCESDQQAVGFGISSNRERAARARAHTRPLVASGPTPARPARGAGHAPRRAVLDLDALLGSHAHGLQLPRGRGGAGAVRKRGSWHLAVGWQAGAGGTVFSPAALKVVDVVQTLSAGGSESRPPWLRLPPENPKRAHVVHQRGRVSAQESRRHMCTAAFRKGFWAQAQAKWTRGTRASQPCRAARRGATQRPRVSQHATGEIAGRSC